MKQKKITIDALPTQRGSILAITLMLLVVLALVGTLAIRNSTQSERVMNSVRTSNVAQQAAETALRFCEQVAQKHDAQQTYGGIALSKIKDTPGTNIERADQGIWDNKINWQKNAANLIELPSTHYPANSAGGVTELKHAPQCIIEKLQNNEVEGYVITARGFGNDAVIDNATGRVTSGAEMWLQSVLTKS